MFSFLYVAREKEEETNLMQWVRLKQAIKNLR